MGSMGNADRGGPLATAVVIVVGTWVVGQYDTDESGELRCAC